MADVAHNYDVEFSWVQGIYDKANKQAAAKKLIGDRWHKNMESDAANVSAGVLAKASVPPADDSTASSSAVENSSAAAVEKPVAEVEPSSPDVAKGIASSPKSSPVLESGAASPIGSPQATAASPIVSPQATPEKAFSLFAKVEEIKNRLKKEEQMLSDHNALLGNPFPSKSYAFFFIDCPYGLDKGGSDGHCDVPWGKPEFSGCFENFRDANEADTSVICVFLHDRQVPVYLSFFHCNYYDLNFV